MTTTLIVFLIVTLLAMIFLPFSRSLMKDRAELHENPLERKFNILISRVNELLMGGKGEVVKFKDDPRTLNLFNKNHANMLIHFYYSTGSLTITLNYKFFQVELVKKMQFDNMRQAETFRQLDVANHFCEEAAISIIQHQAKVNGQRGLKDSTGEFIFPNEAENADSDNPIGLVRRMYNSFSREQKLAWVNIARIIYTADGSSEESFKNHPQFSDLLLNFQVNYSEAQSLARDRGESGILNILRESGDDNLIMKIMPIFPFVMDLSGANEARAEKFYSVFEKLGYPQETVDREIEKMMLLMQHFGMS